MDQNANSMYGKSLRSVPPFDENREASHPDPQLNSISTQLTVLAFMGSRTSSETTGPQSKMLFVSVENCVVMEKKRRGELEVRKIKSRFLVGRIP